MDEMRQSNQLITLLEEAESILSDVKHKFGLFENQRFGKFKSKLNNPGTLNESLKSGLDNIITSDEQAL
jgi:hypothetical protein